jgi:hypothetical protein
LHVSTDEETGRETLWMSDGTTARLCVVAGRIGKFSLCAKNQLTGTTLEKIKEKTNKIDYREFIGGWKEYVMGGAFIKR